MVIEFHCGTCNKLLRTTDDKAGRQARCPECGESIVVPAPASAFVSPAFDFEALEEPKPTGAPFVSSDEPAVTCPMCGTMVERASTHCPGCGEELRMEINLGSTFSTGNAIAFGPVVSQAWDSFLRQPGVSLGAGTVLFLVNALMFAVFGLILYGVADPVFRPDEDFSFEDEPSFRPLVNMVFAGVLGGFVFPLVSMLIGNWLWLGGANFSLKVARGRRASVNDALSTNQRYGRGLFNAFILAVCLLALNVAVGIVLAIFSLDEWPTGTIIMGLVDLMVCIPFMCFYFVVVDRDAPGLLPLRQSQLASDGNFVTMFCIAMFLVVLNILGAIALFVGLIFTIPLSLLILASAYEQMTTTVETQRSAE